MGVAFETLGLSVKGRGKKINQDYFLTRTEKIRDKNFFIVCDGLGSKKHSYHGAKLLAQSANELFTKTKINGENLATIESTLLKKWQEKIHAKKLNIKECSTTFLCAILCESEAFFGRVGDGMIGIFLTEGRELLLQEEKNEDFANLTHPFGSEKMQWLELPTAEIHSLALCSDGISEFIDSAKILPFFKDYISHYKNEKNKDKSRNEIRAWLEDFNRRGFRDDKSLVVAWNCKKKQDRKIRVEK